MKKNLLILFFLSLLFFLHGEPSLVSAAADQTTTTTTTTSVTKTVSVEYMLPFPGILPNHPLYFFKSLRDMLIEKMITSDIKKAEFYILQADKRLQMSIVLSAEDKKELAETMRNDAFMYREKSLQTLSKAAEKNIAIPRYVLEKLLVSTKKHGEILTNMNIDTTAVKQLIPKIEALLKIEIDKK